jgi:dephospho-CoA kinase
MKIAVTGGIATGKSTVSRLLGKCLGVDVIDTDLICRDLLMNGRPGWNGVHQTWGERFMDSQGHIDRVLLRNTIFADKMVRLGLENILHPLVRIEIGKVALQKQLIGEDLLVEIPLLFETGWQDDFTWIITIFATENRCMQRITARDKVTVEDAKRIITAQMPLICKALRADSVIDNSGLFIHTCLQVYHLAGCIRKLR